MVEINVFLFNTFYFPETTSFMTKVEAKKQDLTDIVQNQTFRTKVFIN